MEVGVEVWIKDNRGDQSWIAALVHTKVCLFYVLMFGIRHSTFNLRMLVLMGNALLWSEMKLEWTTNIGV
jgi:hypothetical protein